MNKNLLYSQAYAILGNLTPIPADCGALCGARCCGGDDESGMILFPGEAEFLHAENRYHLECREMAGVSVGFVRCSGTCSRAFRPLSCRIFPLAPLWDGKTLSVIPDPRAALICPLLSAQECISPAFHDAVHRAFSHLLQDAEIEKMLRAYSQMLGGYQQFQGNF